MSFAGLVCKACGERFRDEAPALAHFPTAHVGGDPEYFVPVDLVHLIWATEGTDARRAGAHFSPSALFGCNRETALKRTAEYFVEPLDAWSRTQGTLLHAALEKYVAPGWLAEVAVPRSVLFGTPEFEAAIGVDNRSPGEGLVITHQGVRYRYTYENVWEMEVWPGVWLSGVVDRLKSDFSELHDYKSAKAPGGRYDFKTKRFEEWRTWFPMDESYVMQVNIYGMMVAKAYGVPRPKLAILKNQLGVKDASLSWKRFDIETIDDAMLEARVRERYSELVLVMRKPAETRMARISEMALEGREMFKAKDGTCKCDRYCGLREACDALLPALERF